MQVKFSIRPIPLKDGVGLFRMMNPPSFPNRELLSVIALISIFTLSFFLPLEGVSPIPLCLFSYLSHLDCPGCGLTRSFISISHGDLLGALRFNGIGPVVYLFLLLYLVRSVLRLWRKKNPSFLTLRSRWIYILFAVLLWGQWILKLARQLPQSLVPLLS